MKKRITAIWLALAAACAIFLGGCAKSGSQTTVSSVPDNGIVSKAVFQRLKADGGIAIFKGKTGGTAYEWTFVGPDITSPADTNLKITCQTVWMSLGGTPGLQACEQIKLTQEGSLPGAVSLRVTLGKGWTDGSHPLYTAQPGAVRRAGAAQVTDGVATLRLSENAGPYLLTLAKTTSSAASTVSSSASSPTSSSASSSASFQHGGSVASQRLYTPAPASSAPASSSSAAMPPSPKVQPLRVSITVRCDTAVKKWSSLSASKQDHRVVPANGVILPVTSVSVKKGGTVYDLLVAVCKQKGIQMEHSGTSMGQYINGINNLYEFDAGPLSGWEYTVNGTFPNDSVSQYVLQGGEKVQFLYTCDLGRDIGGSNG